MSWDLFIQDWGNAKTLDDIPDDFEPGPIGSRSEIIKKIKEAEPMVNFDEPSLGRIENEHFSIDISLGADEILMGFVLKVRGNELAVPCISNILDKLNLKAADGSTPNFFDIESGIKSLSEWLSFRNQILGL